jgi:hypothetical protein
MNGRTNKTVQMLDDLLSGKALRTVQGELGRLERVRDEVDTRIARLASADHAIVRKELKKILSNGQVSKLPALKKLVRTETPQHKNVPLLLAAMRARVPVWLFGDTGSGKTTAASLTAESLGLPFRFISVCPTTTKSEFLGYRDAGGKYQTTAFREVFEGGGVFLIDEIDNGNPSILSVLNTALANEHCAFPDGNVKRHEQALIVAAANTIGRGADVRYIGRNALDATTLDRFVFIRMDVDESLETALTGGDWDSKVLANISEGGSMTIEKWREFARKVRSACQELGLEHIVSPRAILYGQALIEAGVGKTHLEDMCIWKGIRDTDKEKIAGFLTGKKTGKKAKPYYCTECDREHNPNTKIGRDHLEYKDPDSDEEDDN